jgi:2'-5' RNA ligase
VRLFVAVELDTPLVDAVLAFAAALRRQIAAAAPDARITWMTAGRLHLTLAFLGHVDNGRVPEIRESLQPPFAGASFDIHVSGVGVFPERGRPRVIWAGIDGGRDRLVTLAAEVAGRLRTTGVEEEARPYSPHLTLARVREAGSLRASTVTAGRERVMLGTSLVRAITLFESRLSPAGPAYHVVQRMDLVA